MLLGVENQAQRESVNDDTVEGATVLMNKIGYLIDEKLSKYSSEKNEDKRKKNEKTAEKFNKIYERLDEITQTNECSVRVSLLVKNMLENRESGWEKTKK
jgi:hypothetical protein